MTNLLRHFSQTEFFREQIILAPIPSSPLHSNLASFWFLTGTLNTDAALLGGIEEGKLWLTFEAHINHMMKFGSREIWI